MRFPLERAPAGSGNSVDTKARQDFRRALLDAVDEGLGALGESARHAIYYHVEQKSQINRDQIPDRIEVFQDALDRLLLAGGIVVQRLIARNLCSRLGIRFEQCENWKLTNYVGYCEKIKIGTL